MSPDKGKEKAKLWAEARKAIKRGDWDTAEGILFKILDLDEREPAALVKLGEVCLEKKDMENAVYSFFKAAEIYGNSGFYNKAIAICKKALKTDDSRLDLKQYIALLYECLKKPNEAKKWHDVVSSEKAAAKEKEVLDFIKGKYDAAGKGDKSADEFCDNLLKIVMGKIFPKL